MNDCLFCKIIRGEIPSEKIYEDGRVFAFLDINPVNPGHVLVIPKQHCDNLLDAPVDDLNALMGAIPKIAKAVISALNYSAFNLGVNNGEEAGQVIHHLHFHIMPRRAGDGYKLFMGEPYRDGEMKDVTEKIKKTLDVEK